MKYDYVRVKQKHLILISQHHWSPTASYPPPLHPLLWPLAPLLLLPFASHRPCFFGNFKNWKEEGDNMHCKHVVLRFEMKITSPHRGFVLDSEQKLRHSWSHMLVSWIFQLTDS